MWQIVQDLSDSLVGTVVTEVWDCFFKRGKQFCREAPDATRQ